MRLKRLEIRGLYGSLTREVSFHEELNLLVGINGSGKTSILNVTDWLLRADFPRLVTTPYERLALTFEHQGRDLTIEAVQSGHEFDLNLHDGKRKKKFRPFNVVLKKPPAQIGTHQELEALLLEYRRLGPEQHERPVWDAIKELPKPTVIALDRTVSAETDERVYFDEAAARYGREPRIRDDSALAQVSKLTSAQFAEYRAEVTRLNEELKARMVLSALRDPYEPFHAKQTPTISVREIANLEQKVIDYVSTALKGDDVAKRTRGYFRRVRSIATQSGRRSKRAQEDMLWMISGRFQQLEDIAEAFDEFEKKSAKAFEHLDLYLKIVNRFLRESNKELAFREKLGHLAFRYLSHNKIKTEEGFRGIRHLSSGERQILILLTFLAFTGREHGIFIVDEPELSLHPKWQSEFLDAFLSLKPPGVQILLATHSPEIVAMHKEACIVLLP